MSIRSPRYIPLPGLGRLPLGLILFAPFCLAIAEETVKVGLPSIEVTAAKTQLDPFEIPEFVSVLDRAAIEREQPTNLGDLLRDLPNVAIGGGPRGQGQTLTIRGLSDERILFLVDGVRQNFVRGHNARVFIEPDLIGRVELLRGPASALWGSGALGGVVALETLDAADLLREGQTLGGRIKLGYQDANHQWLTNAGVYGATADGQFDYLLDIAYRDADDVRLGDGTDLSHSAFERVSGLAKGTWNPDGINSFGLSFMAFDQDGAIPSNPQIASTEDTLVDNDTRQQNLRFSYDREDAEDPYLRPSLLLYHNRTEMEERRLSDGRKDETRLETIGADLHNSMRLGDPSRVAHVLTYGADVYRDTVEGERNGQTRDSYPDGETSVFGLYLQDEIGIGERWTLVPGLRWDSFRSEADSDALDSNEDSALSAKLGLNVAVTDWLSFQAAYNQSFRAPSATELFVSGTHFTCGRGCANLFVPNPNLDPEKARNKEIGLRLRDRDLFTPGDEGRFQARAFRNDVTDFIDQIVIFSMRPVEGNSGMGGITGYRNVRDAKLEGFELEAGYETPRWWAGVAYAQTRGEDDATGEPLSSVHPDTWTLEAGLRFPAQGLRLGWTGRFVDAQDEVPNDGTPSDSYEVHDIRLTWQPGQRLAGLTLELGVDNLLDEDYQPYLASLKSPGRNIKAAVSYRF
ncbi:TonB-dependent hemoglobin/transferrin/lactoferrin family receptor [Imhoffiella purpurea]|uniref:TonB-dependent hemin, ferrichrome receptor n=1 Tax=Imhoffiella purpurea TaxID=1249627 RepID=W9VAH0_9GAMM|nr:TonB-dependent hemoglobin/transferrin/lactoferrin family receptor [Imhoffiella purpurea]EXJ16429.1 TonB-dependent hemin, ferrichrome receptor [Imhoffiella purpurea]